MPCRSYARANRITVLVNGRGRDLVPRSRLNECLSIGRDRVDRADNCDRYFDRVIDTINGNFDDVLTESSVLIGRDRNHALTLAVCTSYPEVIIANS